MPLANWIEDLFVTVSDSTLYFVMAVVGTALFTLRMILMLVGGIDDVGGDFDVDAGGMEIHGGDFSLFSLFSILSFMMGAGWMGLTARLNWNLGSVPSAFIATGFGFALMLFSSWGMWQMRKMSQPTVWNPRSAVGTTGTVYMRIPPARDGRGKVQVSVSGSLRTLDAVSTGEAIDSFKAVKVVDLRDDGTLIVEEV